MPNSGDTVYWDASVFLSYVNGEQERLPTIDALLEESRNGEFTIVTSTLSITEVAFAAMEKTQRALDPQVEQAIDALFADREVVTLVEFHELIAKEARRLMRRALTSGRSLKPPDAIHLATAVQRGADVVHTYDDRMLGYTDLTGLPIELPSTTSPRLLDVPPDDRE